MVHLSRSDTIANVDPFKIEHDWIVRAFGALAQDKRLSVIRLLMRHASSELPAGVIARHFHMRPSTLSFHLARLERAGLIQSRRGQRNIYYRVDLLTAQRLVGFLIQECCRDNEARSQLVAVLETVGTGRKPGEKLISWGKSNFLLR